MIVALWPRSFFIWTTAAGVNRKDEVSAGRGGACLMVGWYVMLSICRFTSLLGNRGTD